MMEPVAGGPQLRVQCSVVGRGAELGEIEACAECPARAADRDRADRAVTGECIERVGHLVAQRNG